MRWLLVGLVGLVVGCSATGPERTQYDDLPVLSTVPEFSLTERSGRTFASSELAGRVWVADFVFTECAGPCPLLSQRMSRLQESLAFLPDVRLVSFSVDPETDTPEVLTEYAKRWSADPERWLFLTGEKAELYHLIKDGFKLAVSDGGEAEGPDGGIITHSTRFVLVDRAGRIRAYFQGNESDVAEKIVPAVQRLTAEAS